MLAFLTPTLGPEPEELLSLRGAASLVQGAMDTDSVFLMVPGQVVFLPEGGAALLLNLLCLQFLFFLSGFFFLFTFLWSTPGICHLCR
jgi:hypothetical protein